MKTLYISDLDGTLLDADARLSAYTEKTLSRLIQNGTAVTFATARTSETAFKILQDVPFRLPAILMNGVVIYDMAAGKCLHKNLIPEETVREIKALLREYGVSGFVYRLLETGLMTYYEELDSSVKRDFVESRRKNYGKPFEQIADFESLPADDTVYFCLVVSRRLIDPAGMHLNGAQSFQLIIMLLNNLLVQRQDNTHIMTALGKCLRQRADDICQTAGLDKR